MSALGRLSHTMGVRVWRLRALGLTSLRVVGVLSITTVVCSVWWGLLGPWVCGAALACAAVHGLVVLAAIERGRQSAAHSGPPAGDAVMRSLRRCCRGFGLHTRRVRTVVVDLGGRRGRGLPLAAATSGLDGAVLFIDDDLEAKARCSSPGSPEALEVEAVVAHELAHVFAHDVSVKIATSLSVLAMTWVAVFAAVASLAEAVDGVAVAVLSVSSLTAAVVADRALARAAEYRADARAGVVTGHPAALASALARDFGDGPGGLRAVLATHPSTSRRCARLMRQHAELHGTTGPAAAGGGTPSRT